MRFVIYVSIISRMLTLIQNHYNMDKPLLLAKRQFSLAMPNKVKFLSKNRISTSRESNLTKILITNSNKSLSPIGKSNL